MKINGVSIINFKSKNQLYQCDVILDGKFLGNFKQSNGYSDNYSFDKTILENSKECFKTSKLYKINYFKDNVYSDFYTVNMFINDLCDLYQDEIIFKNLLKKNNKIRYLLIAESLITNKTLYCGIIKECDIDIKKKKMKSILNGSAIFRVYNDLNNFEFDNRNDIK
ncbi:MAG: hypothetical protein ACLRYM_14935 [Thomasclavelia ramosa]